MQRFKLRRPVSRLLKHSRELCWRLALGPERSEVCIKTLRPIKLSN